MKYDFSAHLCKNKHLKFQELYTELLSSGSLHGDKDNELSEILRPKPDFSRLPYHPNWVGLEVSFTLQTPWYSRDDAPRALDNPLRRERLCGTPFMPASAWKGLLRWACRMQEKQPPIGKGDPEWIRHLFGNEWDAQEGFQQGALIFYPTWFEAITPSIEVINPHSRAQRKGTHPIYYETIPAREVEKEENDGCLYLLYAPRHGAQDHAGILEKLLGAVKDLLCTYGISAKRTSGWGRASIHYDHCFRWDINDWDKLKWPSETHAEKESSPQ